MRIRTIKPEFFLHEGLFEAERAAKLPLRLAFAGLWCAADREGRFKWEPRRLGVQILPYDNADFARVLDALATRGFIRKYASGTAEYGVIPSFTTHQVINNRESESELPEPPAMLENQGFDACGTRDGRDDDGMLDLKSGREGNKEQGREGNKEQKESPPALVLPFESHEFAEAWHRWTKYRKEIKKPITPTMAESQLKNLAAMGEGRAIAMIENTISKGWQGLREEVEPQRGNAPRRGAFDQARMTEGLTADQIGTL